MKKIIFSLTAHEAPDCLLDLIENIRHYSRDYECVFLVACTEPVYAALSQHVDEKVIVTNVRDTTDIWGKIDVFHLHVINMQYLFDHSVDFDYFWFVASNEYFIKDIVAKPVIVRGPRERMSERQYTQYFFDFAHLDPNAMWAWWKHMRMDSYTMEYFRQHQLEFHCNQHEGLVLDKNLCEEITREWAASGINESSSHRGYCMEEIFIPSYVYTKYVVDYYPVHCARKQWHNRYFDEYASGFVYAKVSDTYFYESMLNYDDVYSIKPVARVYHDEFRSFLRRQWNPAAEAQTSAELPRLVSAWSPGAASNQTTGTLEALLRLAHAGDWGAQADRAAEYFQKFENASGRLGFKSDRWRPGIFFGFLLRGDEHRVQLLAPQDGSDFCLMLDVDITWPGLNQYDGHPAYQSLVQRLRANPPPLGFEFLDHLAINNGTVNRWHPIHLRKNVKSLFDGCNTVEDQVAIIRRGGVELLDYLFQDGEIDAIKKDFLVVTTAS